MAVFLKNLKSWFIVDDVNINAAESSEKEETKTESIAQKNVVLPAVPASAGKVNDKFMEVLFNAMSEHNVEGFDYLEFKQSLQSLSKMPMDEATKYQSAFAMAQTMGVTAPKLIETADHYLKVLKQEEQKFGEALNKQRLQQIGNREEQIASLDNAMKTKTQQIQTLTQEIEQHGKQMEQLKQEISQSTVKVETTKNDFLASFNALTGQISSDVDNMKKYLK